MTLSVMRSPRHIDLEITGRCNLQCTYCSHFTSAGDVTEELPTDEWVRFFDELTRATVMRIVFSGGEPFVRGDLFTLLSELEARPMRFAILTNGTLIDAKTAATLSNFRHLDYIQISLDGADAESHDTFRGTGCFERTCSAIDCLLRVGITPVVRVTIHRRNVERIEAIARFILEELSLPTFSTNSASYMGLCRQNAAITQLTPEEYSHAMEALLELAARYPGRISATAGPLADGYAWWAMEEARQGRREPPLGGGYLTGCHGPFQTLAVRADGAMIACQQLGHLTLGQINRDPLIPVWQHHPRLAMIRNRNRIPLSSFPMCRECPYQPFCTGNCPATAYTTWGEENSPSPEGCLRLFLERGGRIPTKWNQLNERSAGTAP